jgi:hypothetical protein
MRVDLSGTGSGFDPIPAGRYQAKITDGELREAGPNAKHTGSEYINWEFTISEGEYESRKLWQNTPWSHGDCDCGDWKPGSLFGLKAILKSSGVWTDDELDADDFEFEIDDLIGSDFTLTVAVRDYQGEDVNDVKRVKPAGQGGSTASTLLP